MKKEYGLVFAGGGTKGAYQVGVCKALKEMHINIKGVSGASIGSLNAALFVQNDVELMEKIYSNIKMTDILKISDSTVIKSDNLFTVENALALGGEYLKEHGISNEPLSKLVDKYIDVDKIYRSKMDFGIITYDAKKLTAVEKFKNEIAKKDLKEYLLASSCFPIFKPQKLNDSFYLDGGIGDNMPVNMLIKKGYKDIILVDIAGIGNIRKNVKKNVFIKVIKPNEDLGGTFDFNRENINKNIKLGYYDTLKAFYKVHGKHFYFSNYEYYKMLNNYSVDEIEGLEEAGLIYNIEKLKIYKAQEYIDKVLENYAREENKYKKIRENKMNLQTIKEALSADLGISIAMDIITNYPTFATNNLVLKLLGNNLKAASSIQVARNNKRISSFWG